MRTAIQQRLDRLLRERNALVPYLGYNADLYRYTDNQTLMGGTFKEVHAMQPYDRDAFAAAIEQLPEEGQGPTMLQAGLNGLRKVVTGLNGRTAVIIFTDGTFTIQRGIKKPLQIAQEIAGDRDVRFYLISSATARQRSRINSVRNDGDAVHAAPLRLLNLPCGLILGWQLEPSRRRT